VKIVLNSAPTPTLLVCLSHAGIVSKWPNIFNSSQNYSSFQNSDGVISDGWSVKCCDFQPHFQLLNVRNDER